MLFAYWLLWSKLACSLHIIWLVTAFDSFSLLDRSSYTRCFCPNWIPCSIETNACHLQGTRATTSQGVSGWLDIDGNCKMLKWFYMVLLYVMCWMICLWCRMLQGLGHLTGFHVEMQFDHKICALFAGDLDFETGIKHVTMCITLPANDFRVFTWQNLTTSMASLGGYLPWLTRFVQFPTVKQVFRPQTSSNVRFYQIVIRSSSVRITMLNMLNMYTNIEWFCVLG